MAIAQKSRYRFLGIKFNLRITAYTPIGFRIDIFSTQSFMPNKFFMARIIVIRNRYNPHSNLFPISRDSKTEDWLPNILIGKKLRKNNKVWARKVLLSLWEIELRNSASTLKKFRLPPEPHKFQLRRAPILKNFDFRKFFLFVMSSSSSQPQSFEAELNELRQQLSEATNEKDRLRIMTRINAVKICKAVSRNFRVVWIKFVIIGQNFWIFFRDNFWKKIFWSRNFWELEPSSPISN